MLTRCSSALPFALTLITLVVSAPAFAQVQRDRPGRPYRGLFGTGTASASWDQVLSMHASLGTGFDDQSQLNDVGSATPTRRTGLITDMSTGLNYSIGRSRFGFSGSLDVGGRYYPGLRDSFAAGFGSEGAGWLRLTKTVVLRMSTGRIYRPFDGVQLLPGISGENPRNLTPLDTRSLAVAPGTQRRAIYSLEFSQALSNRSSISATLSADRSTYPGVAEHPVTWRTAVGYSHAVAKGLSLRFGYAQQSQRYPDASGGLAPPVMFRSIDTGVDFLRTLSFSRRTTLAFNVGTGTVTDQYDTVFRVTGNAVLTHELGRSWVTTFSYYRNVGFVAALVAPTYSDSFTAYVNGLFGRRVGFTAGFADGLGAVGGSRKVDDYTSYVGYSSLTFGLTHNLGLGVHYMYYAHSFATGLALAPGVLPDASRQSISASVSFWAPLIERARRRNASR